MNEQEAINKMVMPSQSRANKRMEGVIQIWVTHVCDNQCFGCTQGSNLKRPASFITLNQFDKACASLKNYFGVVGVFGGNPAMHPQFPELCEILTSHIPFNRRGLWCNRIFKHGAIASKTFNPAVSNLNVHLDKVAYEEFRRTWPRSKPFGLTQDSRHSPPYVAILDLIEDEEESWDLIVNCDINKYWSAMISVFREELRGYFCEIAGSQAMMHQYEGDYPDLGVPIDNNWWKRPREAFAEQIKFHCQCCGVPLRGYGELAQSVVGQEQITETHESVFTPKDKDRDVQVVTCREEIMEQGLAKMTDYLGNSKRGCK